MSQCKDWPSHTDTRDYKYHGRSKLIDTRHHCIQDIIAHGQIIFNHISTYDIIANPFTKPLSRDMFLRHVKELSFI